MIFSMIYRMLNNAVKRTNWWKNQFLYTEQFVSNEGYRNDLRRNYDVVNVGSNPARFAFDYSEFNSCGLDGECVPGKRRFIGENWSTGTQGLDYDLEILKFYHSYLRKGAVVILPIVPFTSVSGYLEKNGFAPAYLAKYAMILDWLQVRHSKDLEIGRNFIRRPLNFEKKAWRYIFRDVRADRKMEIAENPLDEEAMEKDAERWMSIWAREFDIEDFNRPLTPELMQGRERSLERMSRLVEFLAERGYRVVLVSTPMSKALTSKFNRQIKETYIYSFVNKICNKYTVEYKDYTEVPELADHSLYQNGLFMNSKGRKVFTRRILGDLGLL